MSEDIVLCRLMMMMRFVQHQMRDHIAAAEHSLSVVHHQIKKYYSLIRPERKNDWKIIVDMPIDGRL